MPIVVLYGHTMSDRKKKSRNCKHELDPPFGMAGEPVTQDGNSVDRTAAVKVDF